MVPRARVSIATRCSFSTRRAAFASPPSCIRARKLPDIALVLENVDKIYQRRGKPPVHAVKALNMAIEVRRDRCAAGFLRLRQDIDLADDRRLRGGLGGQSHARGSAHRATAAGQAQCRDGLRRLFALSAADGARQHRFRAEEFGYAGRADPERGRRKSRQLLEIEPILDRYPSSISGGQQQRASLARALVRSADLYLLDEPMGQLEPQLRAVLRGRLKNLLLERRMTSIFVTHDQTEANALADRIAVMEGGVLQQFAGQRELKDRPANLFVATFVGEPPMNVFDADATNAERVRFAVANGPTLDYAASEIPPAVASAIGSRAPGRRRRAPALRAAWRRRA